MSDHGLGGISLVPGELMLQHLSTSCGPSSAQVSDHGLDGKYLAPGWNILALHRPPKSVQVSGSAGLAWEWPGWAEDRHAVPDQLGNGRVC